jgi:DsbC/DsbD-like thiol-disulfide interchange protein
MNEAMNARFRRRNADEYPRPPRGLFLAAFFALFGFATAAGAADAPPSLAGERIDLIADVASAADQPRLFGVRMVMREGWHTYWRSPGDSGIAPHFDWSGSQNAADVKLLWPAPERFDAEGDMTVGYSGDVIWPVLVRAADAGKPVKLDLKMSYGICSDICVPGEAHLTLANVSSGNGEAIRRALAHVPSAPQNESDVGARLDGKSLLVTLKGAHETPSLIVEGPRGVWFGKPEATKRGDALDYRVPVEMSAGKSLAHAEVVLTFSGPETAIEATRKLE